MIDYRISLYQASRHRIQVHVTLPTPADETILRIAAWRPGRYEEGNFARLISNLNAYHGSQRIRTEKISKNEWLVHTKGIDSIDLSYLYYGAELTAGNTYLDEKLLLINPVNLLVYNDFCKKSEIKLTIDIPHAWSLAGLEHKPNGVAQFSSGRLNDTNPYWLWHPMNCTMFGTLRPFAPWRCSHTGLRVQAILV